LSSIAGEQSPICHSPSYLPYRDEIMKSVTADRRFLTGLLGAPIAKSAAPAMHERAAEALGLRCHYHLIEIAGATREELRLLLEGISRLGFAGINVTFPYREAVVDLLDEVSPAAALIGAVNTVVVRDRRQGQGRQGPDRARACDLCFCRRVRAFHRAGPVHGRDGDCIR
jgi:hypothetical protein